MFRVGQKVVCVKGPLLKNSNTIQPKIGEIYTIREIYVDPLGGEGLRLVEIICPKHSSGMEYGYFRSRFRPVVERKTDISVFTEILKTKRNKINA